MQSTTLIASAALVAAVFSVGASAQTGRPAAAPSDRPTQVVAGDAAVGSYARYLMLNGMTRDDAVKAAQSYDHPAPSTRFAVHTVRPRNAAAPATSVQQQ